MRARKWALHIGITVLGLSVLAGLPLWRFFKTMNEKSAVDAVSGASVSLPEEPSGNFIVLLNTARHEESIDDWKKFFLDEDFPVIFEDLSCIVAEGDSAGIQMAERFQAQLPEHQMTLRTEDPTLLVSKAEAGLIDVAVFSKEMAEALGLRADESKLTVIGLTGGED